MAFNLTTILICKLNLKDIYIRKLMINNNTLVGLLKTKKHCRRLPGNYGKNLTSVQEEKKCNIKRALAQDFGQNQRMK